MLLSGMSEPEPVPVSIEAAQVLQKDGVVYAIEKKDPNH